MHKNQSAIVGLVMGSPSDWTTMKYAATVLTEFNIPFHQKIVSAHRTPDRLFAYAEGSLGNGLEVIIAGAGGAAHLPGMIAAKTIVPVIGVPVASKHLNGLDSLLSIVQMPTGIPVATVAIGENGAKNASLLAIAILAIKYPSIREQLISYRKHQTESVLHDPEIKL